MIALARDLLLFKAAPQDLPYSPLLLALLIGLGLSFDGVILHLGGESPQALLALVGSTIVRLLLLTLWFSWRGIAPRLVKTLSALWLADLAFRALLLPSVLLIAGEVRSEPPPSPSPAAQLAALAMIALAMWQLLVQGHILRHALELPLALGTLFALIVGLMSFGSFLALLAILPGSP
jgi:hypothetical protein